MVAPRRVCQRFRLAFYSCHGWLEIVEVPLMLPFAVLSIYTEDMAAISLALVLYPTNTGTRPYPMNHPSSRQAYRGYQTLPQSIPC